MSSFALFLHGLKWFIFGLFVGALAVWWFKDWIRAQATAIWVWLKSKITRTPPALFLLCLIAVFPLSAMASTGTAIVGQSATISVASDGTQPLTYQWAKNGTDIAGATSPTYVIATLALTDGGTYTVKITNSVGSVVSDAAVLTVNPPPVAPTRATTNIVITSKQTTAISR